MKRVTVTGAGGFIGSHLVERLVQDGYRVKALCRYNSRSDAGHLDALSPEVREGIEVVFGDLRDRGSVDSLLREPCEYVLHLGALIGIPYSYENPDGYVQTNVTGTLNVLQAALRNSAIERVVVTSTSEVYGTAQYVPIDEKHPLQGQSPYSASKIGADHLAESFFRSFELPVGILRPFNTFGPRQSLRAVIPTIIAQLLDPETTELRLGSLDPRRDLTFVADTADAFVRMCVSDIPFGTPINVGQGKDISIGELADALMKLAERDLPITTDPNRVRPSASEVLRLNASAELAKEHLGWRPTVTLDEGLSRTIDWMRTRAPAKSHRYHV